MASRMAIMIGLVGLVAIVLGGNTFVHPVVRSEATHQDTELSPRHQPWPRQSVDTQESGTRESMWAQPLALGAVLGLIVAFAAPSAPAFAAPAASSWPPKYALNTAFGILPKDRWGPLEGVKKVIDPKLRQPGEGYFDFMKRKGKM